MFAVQLPKDPDDIYDAEQRLEELRARRSRTFSLGEVTEPLFQAGIRVFPGGFQVLPAANFCSHCRFGISGSSRTRYGRPDNEPIRL